MNLYHFALVVGINRYPGVSDLEGPVLDGERIRDWLMKDDGGGVPEFQIERLNSPLDPDRTLEVGSARPVQRDIFNALTKINDDARRVIDEDGRRRAESRLYVYLAGHGIMPGVGAALLTADAHPAAFYAVAVHTVHRWYETAGIFRELVLLADCCRHAQLMVDDSATLPERALPSGEQVVAMTGYAAEAGLTAYEGGPAGDRRGFFTRALLDGLEGAARVEPRYGQITSTTLADYVSVAVFEATRHKPFPQRVEMPSDPANPILFGARRRDFEVTLHFPGAWTGAFELALPGGARQYCLVDGPTLTLRLEPGLYALFQPGTWRSLFAQEGFEVTGATGDVVL